MQTRWTKHIRDREEREKFKSRLLANRDMLGVLENLIQEDVEKSLSDMQAQENYTLPAWSEHTAHQLGIQQEADRLLKLIRSLDQERRK